MPKIIFADHKGNIREVDARAGETVMEAAVKNAVAGIDADCGGACACATCHVYVDATFADKIDPQQEMERSMLDFAENVRPTSRLSCQIRVTEALDGLRVQTPESQH
jgi:ferredoxin, 2Fe-2S